MVIANHNGRLYFYSISHWPCLPAARRCSSDVAVLPAANSSAAQEAELGRECKPIMQQTRSCASGVIPMAGEQPMNHLRGQLMPGLRPCLQQSAGWLQRLTSTAPMALFSHRSLTELLFYKCVAIS
jgi:hypothetical protein